LRFRIGYVCAKVKGSGWGLAAGLRLPELLVVNPANAQFVENLLYPAVLKQTYPAAMPARV